MKAGKFILPIIILIAATLFFSIFIVKEVNQAIVLQFGDPKRIILNVLLVCLIINLIILSIKPT